MTPTFKIAIIRSLEMVAQSQISGLREFFDNGGRTLASGLDELKKHFFIVGLFTTFEMFLRDTLVAIHLPDEARMKCIWGLSLDEIKKEFSKFGVPITKPDREWQAIMGMKEVRNCILHGGGWPDPERAKKLVSSRIQVGDSKMVFPGGYFRECITVIEGACKRIAEDCQDALREGDDTSASTGQTDPVGSECTPPATGAHKRFKHESSPASWTAPGTSSSRNSLAGTAPSGRSRASTSVL